MNVYRIHRMKDSARQQFRWSPHTLGITNAKPKDYEVKETLEAESPYALWLQLKDTEGALEVGDILESSSGHLRIYKYVGFEEAQWFVPEVKPVAEPVVPVDPAATAVG